MVKFCGKLKCVKKDNLIMSYIAQSFDNACGETLFGRADNLSLLFYSTVKNSSCILICFKHH